MVMGATGAVGQRLLPLLIDEGHEVVAVTRTPAKADALRAQGAIPVVADALDREAVLGAVLGAEPEVVVHQLTALDGMKPGRNFDRLFALTNRLRDEGTRHLVEAARAAGTRRVIAQSFTGWPFARDGGPVKAEDERLDPTPVRGMREAHAAIASLERQVRADPEGVVLRYGGFYGPGTNVASGGDMAELVAKRRVPVLGDGGGMWSFTHVDDAAGGVVATLGSDVPGGTYAIVDDEPAPVREWLPALAGALGAPPPRHVPRWVGRLAAGAPMTMMMTEARGASNAWTKATLGWEPRWPTWREGFAHGLG